MNEILSSAAYVRCEGKSPRRVIPEASPATQRIWELLETPQTVTTICRVLATEGELQPDRCEPQVRSFMSKLYREDLIQLSPDS